MGRRRSRPDLNRCVGGEGTGRCGGGGGVKVRRLGVFFWPCPKTVCIGKSCSQENPTTLLSYIGVAKTALKNVEFSIE